jgi:hypothetical protein
MANIENMLIVVGVVGLVVTYLLVVHSFISKAEQP